MKKNRKEEPGLFDGNYPANRQNPSLKGIKVFLSGDFGNLGIAFALKANGAEISPSVTKNVRYMFVGESPATKDMEEWEKLLHNGFRIPIGHKEEAARILAGDIDWIVAMPEVRKALDFTMDHYRTHRVAFEGMRNIIASKEIFYGKGFAGDFYLFGQLTGNLGAFGDNIQIYPETDMCLLSDSTLLKLENGEKDETICYIEDFYNKSSTVTFKYSFLSESEVLDYCERRCRECGDKLTMGILEKYRRSVKNTLPPIV